MYEQLVQTTGRTSVYLLSYKLQTENLPVPHHITDSAHLRPHFTVAWRLANLCYINIINNNNNNWESAWIQIHHSACCTVMYLNWKLLYICHS